MSDKNLESQMARILADNDQDLALAREWFREATTGELMAVWTAIQQDFGDNPLMEIVTRLAQLQFGTLWYELVKGLNEGSEA